MSAEVRIPLINPNEPDALIAAIHVAPGDYVQAGQPLCTLETTKSAADLNADTAGYVVGLEAVQGQNLRAGDLLCYLADTPDWQPPKAEAPSDAGKGSAGAGSPASLPPGLRITRPALDLARKHALDLSRLPTGPMVTESTVRQVLEQGAAGNFSTPQAAFDPRLILIYGAGGHAKIVLDLLRALPAYQVVGLIDDGRTPGERVMGAEVLGSKAALSGLYNQGVRLAVNAIGGISNIAPRIQVFRLLAEAGFAFPTLVHPTAYVEPSASLSPGAQILAQAYVGSEASVGFGSIVSTGAIVSHDCQLGSYVNVSPGALLAGDVRLGEGVLVGMGATVNLGVSIGRGGRVGNSATVKSDVPAGGIVRAGAVWPE